jgi:hypothetical protein
MKKAKVKPKLATPPIVKMCHACGRGFISKFEAKRHICKPAEAHA